MFHGSDGASSKQKPGIQARLSRSIRVLIGFLVSEYCSILLSFLFCPERSNNTPHKLIHS